MADFHLDLKYQFFHLLDSPELDKNKLQNFLLSQDDDTKIELLDQYFLRFRTSVHKNFDIDKTLEPMEKVSEAMELYNLINNTPGLSYKLLRHCDTMPYMKWAVEKMKINPLGISESTPAYSRIFSPKSNPNYMSGKYIDIMLINADDNTQYMCGLKPTENPNHIATVKDDLVYHFMGQKDKHELMKYLVSLGCGKEVIDKKVSIFNGFTNTLKNIITDSFMGALNFSILFFILCYLFYTVNTETSTIIVSSALIISILNALHNVKQIFDQFKNVKQYLLNL